MRRPDRRAEEGGESMTHCQVQDRTGSVRVTWRCSRDFSEGEANGN